jgi:uncharacterized protein (TIGR02246 family)
MNCLAMRAMVMMVVLLTTARAWGEQPKADPTDEKALRELHQAFLAAFNKGDAEAVAALHAPDADFLAIGGEMLNGRREIKKRNASLFAQGVKLTSPLGSIRFITPHVAIADRPSELTPAPENRPGKVHATVVYVKRDGKWLIAAVRLMVPIQASR